MSLTFIHISDTHISHLPDYHPPWAHPFVQHPNVSVRKLIHMMNHLPFAIDFVLHTGDVCADPLIADCTTARELLAQSKHPIYMIPGNHDDGELMMSHIHDGQLLHVLRDERVTINGYDVIALDTNGLGDAHAPTVSDRQLAWLSDELRDAGHMIVAAHHPLQLTGVDWIDHKMRVQNGGALHDLLKQHTDRLHGVLHGHIHQSVNTYSDGVLYMSCPSTWYNLQGDPTVQTDMHDPDMPAGFNLVMIRNNHMFSRRYVL